MVSPNQQGQQVASNPPPPAANGNNIEQAAKPSENPESSEKGFAQVQEGIVICSPCKGPPTKMTSPVRMEQQQVFLSKNKETEINGGDANVGESIREGAEMALSSNTQRPVVNNVKNNADDEQASVDLLTLVSSPQINHSASKTGSVNDEVETVGAAGSPSASTSLRGKTLQPKNNENTKTDDAETPKNEMADAILAKDGLAAAETSNVMPVATVATDEPAATDGHSAAATAANEESAATKSENPTYRPPRGKTLVKNEETLMKVVNGAQAKDEESTEIDAREAAVTEENNDDSNVMVKAIVPSDASLSGEKLVNNEETDPRVVNGATTPQSNGGESIDSEATIAISPRGMVLPGRAKTVDQSEHAPIGDTEAVTNEAPPSAEISAIPPFEPPSGQLLDDSGNPTEYNQHDIFLSLKNSTYKVIMFDHFKKIGAYRTTEGDKTAANEMFERFKKTGERFFQLTHNTKTSFYMVDEQTALEKIESDFKCRMRYSKQWLEEEQPNDTAAFVVRSSRKRNRPQNFMDAQGQDVLVREDLRQQSAAAKKRRALSPVYAEKPFSINENRQFELGSTKHGWDNWAMVQTLVSNRTVGEIENHAVMIANRYPEIKARLIEEHNQIWVYPEREQPLVSTVPIKQTQQPKVTKKLPVPGDGEEGPAAVRKSSRARENTWKTRDDAGDTLRSSSPKPEKKASKNVKAKRNRTRSEEEYDDHEAPETKNSRKTSRTKGNRNKKESEIDAPEEGYDEHDVPETKKPRTTSRTKGKRNKKESESDAPVIDPGELFEDAHVGRPKRQSAINARKRFAALSSGDEKDGYSTVDSLKSAGSLTTGSAASSRGSSRASQNIKLKRETEKLLKGLSYAPSNNGEFYEEESSWRFHNPAFLKDSKVQLTALRADAIPHMPAPTQPAKLQPLPPAPPLPELPTTQYCKWTFDEKSRVLLANFRDSSYGKERDKTKVGIQDKTFLYQMMERDDITVISEGLADTINSSLWTREYIQGKIGSEYHHKFRGFETISQTDGAVEQTKEKVGWYNMKVSDYFQYLEQRQAVKNSKLESTMENKDLTLKETFRFTDSSGEEKSVNVDSEALYMIDVDMVKLLPQAFEDLQHNFKLPGILPGGSHCMMNAVNANGRPFMGPNLYITPPTSFTNFHQDGHGTVDSGHLCMSGYNEVVMLRRLTERHKCHAIRLLTGTTDAYSTLYGLPHRDNSDAQVGWPSTEAILQCETMGYYPSVFILKAGQVVHINKGRLHAFRKLAPSSLLKTDCHYDLRNEILQSKEHPTEDMCFSIAWDWMFKGVSPEGINREVSSIMECARLNREHDLPSLAIPETALIFLAKESITKYQLDHDSSPTNSLFGMDIRQGQTRVDTSEPDAVTVLRGILPALHYVVTRHNTAVKFSKKWENKTKHVKDSWRVSIESKPNAWEDPGTFALDPYGAGDFFCKFCSEELSNVYMHCDGCEKLLNKDFNICSSCHQEGKYKVFRRMHPFNEKPHSILNHTGNRTFLRQSRCPCKNGKECMYCSYCTGCSCRCHQWFTLHYRFMGLGNELDILQKAERIVGLNTISQTAETKARLLSLISDGLPQEERVISSDDMLCKVIEVKTPKAKKGRPSVSIAPSTPSDNMICTVVQEQTPQTKNGKASIATAAGLKQDAKKEETIDEGAPLQPPVASAMTRETTATTAASLKHEDAEKKESLGEEPPTQPSTATEKPATTAARMKQGEAEKQEPPPQPSAATEIPFGPTATPAARSNQKEMQKKEPPTTATEMLFGPTATNAARLKQVDANKKEPMVEEPPPQPAEAPGNATSGGRVSLEDAAATGCTKCQKELETGRKIHSSHSDHCPRSRKTGRSVPKPKARNRGKTEASRINRDVSKAKLSAVKGEERDGKNKSKKTKSTNQTVTFHCHKCNKDFSWKCANAAPGAFANHTKHCDPEKKQKRSRKHKRLAEEEDLPDDETDVSTNEVPAEAMPPLDRDQLKAGDRVVALCKDGFDWLATIRRRHQKKGKHGFMIQYKGNKSSVQDWVPTEWVVRYQGN